MRIGIIGGGLAGLAAAYEFTRRLPGCELHLFEAEAELGGQAGTFPLEGTRLERFYHHIFTSDRDLVALFRELGLESELMWLDSQMGFYHTGRIHNFVTPLDLLRFSPLPLLDRLKAGVLALYLQRLNDWRRFEGITARDWILRYAGERIWDVIWGSQLRSKFGQSHHEVSMVWFWGKMKLRFGSRRLGGQRESLGYLRGSFQVLTDALARAVRGAGGYIHTRAPVERIGAQGDRVTGLRTAGGGDYALDLVLATIPSYAFLELAPQLPADYAELLSRARYKAALCLVLKMSQPLSHIYWLNLSAPEIPFVAAIEHTNFIPATLYGGKHIVYLSNYLELDDPVYSLSKDELLEHYAPYIQRINPGFSTSWVEESWLFRARAGQPIITTHYSRLVPPHQTPIAGLYLANTTQIYPEDRGMNYSIRLGRQVAELMAKEM